MSYFRRLTTFKRAAERRRHRICVAALGAAALATLVPTPVAHAEAPRNRGCFGQDISSYARGVASYFGQFMAQMATSANGVSDEVAYHKAGLVPDAVVANSCND